MLFPPPDPNIPMSTDGLMNDQFRRWTVNVTNEGVIIGTGSPEGVITAGQGRIYMDDSGSAGSILYVKKLTDISGDQSKGWILV